MAQDARSGSRTVWQDESVEGMVDELMPEGFDWRGLTRSYPWPALALAAAGGFALGRRHGAVLLAAVSRFAIDEAAHHLSAFLDPGTGA